MKKIFLATLVLLFSSSIFAQNIGHYSHSLGDKLLKTAIMKDKNTAVVEGNKIRDNLETLNSIELSKKLNIWSNTYNSTKLKNTSMTVSELYAQNGTIGYQAVVNVKYQYTVRESNK
ncbi:DUF3316 domain-containing protein [Photobacterium carnosum]|uniref:DUF3316 domain-containing protein n=1 Tax=Photobacterium carnosum TaxID=2023717 RepID=UPI001E2A7274|nr:DUF3316 domain-containing protein [Photobacterium carnosum]MCD9515627.1 DUF3316 domain-containing protein [Photobacterium carnosum]